VDPGTVSNFRSAAGLPDANAGRFVSQGILKSLQGVVSRGAQVLKPGQEGGLPEVVVPRAQQAIELQRVSGINSPF